MVVRYTDGGILICHSISIEGNCLYVDGLYEIPIESVEEITEDE